MPYTFHQIFYLMQPLRRWLMMRILSTSFARSLIPYSLVIVTIFNIDINLTYRAASAPSILSHGGTWQGDDYDTEVKTAICYIAI